MILRKNEDLVTVKNKKDKRELILEGNLVNTFIKIAVPMMLIAFIQPMAPIIDNLFVSRIGDTQLAAVGFVNPIISFATAFGTGLGFAGIALIGQCIGRREDEKAKSLSLQLIIFSLIIGAIFAALIMAYGQFALGDLKGQLLTNTQIYLSAVSFGIPLNFLNSTYVAVKRAYGETAKPLYLNISSLVLKTLLNFVMIYIFRLGLIGAAYATIITSAVIVIFEIVDLFVLKTNQRLTFKNFSFEKSTAWMFVKLGFPTALSGASSQFSFILMNSQAISYGEEVLTAYGIANSLNSLFFGPMTAAGTALATIVSQNIGAKQRERAREATNKAILISFIASIFFAIILVITSRLMVKMFTHTPEILRHGTTAMQIYSISVIGWAIFQAQLGAFIGIGQTKVPLYATIIRIWVIRIPFVYLCQLIYPEMKEYIIWYSMLVSNIGVAIYTTFKLKRINWKYKLIV
jgi:putative MATE family efflux protein